MVLSLYQAPLSTSAEALSYAGDVPPEEAQADPSILLLLAHLKSVDKDTLELCQEELASGHEMVRVRSCVDIYWRMGNS